MRVADAATAGAKNRVVMVNLRQQPLDPPPTRSRFRHMMEVLRPNSKVQNVSLAMLLSAYTTGCFGSQATPRLAI